MEAQNVKGTIASVQQRKVTETGSTTVEASRLEKLGQSLKNGNQVCMKIKNLSDTPMTRGSVACISGIMHSVLPQSISPNEFECIGFQKTTWYIPRGTSGIVGYELGNSKLCIWYYNPVIGINRGGFLWVNSDYRIEKDTGVEIWRRGMHFQGYDVMEWKSLSNAEFVAEGFISRGNPAYFHVHVRNA